MKLLSYMFPSRNLVAISMICILQLGIIDVFVLYLAEEKFNQRDWTIGHK